MAEEASQNSSEPQKTNTDTSSQFSDPKIGGQSSLSYPIDANSQGAIENTMFKTLQSLKFKGGLPVLTATPTYTGIQGETVTVDTGSARSICSYLNGNWRCVTLGGTGTYVQVDQSEHNPSTADWEDWDISSVIPVGTTEVEVLIHNSSVGTKTGKTRKNGDTTITTIIALLLGENVTELCPVGADRIIEIKSNDAAVGFRILGYRF